MCLQAATSWQPRSSAGTMMKLGLRRAAAFEGTTPLKAMLSREASYDGRCMANPVNPVPQGFHTLTPHLMVRGASDYIDFLTRAFGAVELNRSPGADGRLMHATVQIGDSLLMLNDHFPEFGAPPIAEGHWPVTLSLYVPDADATFAQAVAAGCKATMPLADQFWGDRYGQLKDPFGFVWAIATHKEDLTPDQVKQRFEAAFGGGH